MRTLCFHTNVDNMEFAYVQVSDVKQETSDSIVCGTAGLPHAVRAKARMWSAPRARTPLAVSVCLSDVHWREPAVAAIVFNFGLICTIYIGYMLVIYIRYIVAHRFNAGLQWFSARKFIYVMAWRGIGWDGTESF